MSTIAQSKFKDGPVVLVSKEIHYSFPVSYAYLSGYLKEQGEDVRVLFRHRDKQRLAREIMELDPVLVGFGNLYPELKEIGEIIKLLNEAGREFSIVIGGQMVSPIPEFAVRITGADYGVIGEGEIVLHQLTRALREGKDPFAVKGLAIRDGEDVQLTGPGEYMQDLSKLPAIPYEFFPSENWLPIGKWYSSNCPQPHWRFEDRVVNIHGGRGCPFRCNFCYHHSHPRYRPISMMIDEAKELLERFDGNMLYFSDDLVLSTPKRAQELVEALRGLKRPIEYSVSARFDSLARIDDDLLAQMKETGCRIMGLGIESGSDRLLKIIGKNCTSQEVLHQLKRLKKAGILPTVSIMIGQHTETREDVEASIELMRQSVRDNPNICFSFSIMTPFPGSPLYELIFREGYLKDDREFYDRYFTRRKETGDWAQVVNLSAMSEGEVFAMYQKITQIYLEEKAKSFGRSVVLVEKIKVLFGKVHRRIDNRMFSRIRDKRFFKPFLNVYQFLYDLIQLRMERLSLKMRGVI